MPAGLRTCVGSRCPGHRDGRVAAAGDVGRMARAIRAAGAAGAARARHVLRVLADLRPMAEVGPIDLDEARRVLCERLRLLEGRAARAALRPAVRRHAAQARGRTFRVVFVPGVAERMFPQKPREDALLLGRSAAG